MAKKWANLEAWFMSEVDEDVRNALAEQIGFQANYITCITSPWGEATQPKIQSGFAPPVISKSTVDSTLCECGCGKEAPIRTYTVKARGMFKGERARFIAGHCSRVLGPRREDHNLWRGDEATKAVKNKRARRWFSLRQFCDLCKTSKATDRHHKDGDPGNNSEVNIAHLCRKCHMVTDGRLAKLIAFKPPVISPKECNVCGRLSKPLRKGKCHACNEYFRRRERLHGGSKL